MTEDQWEDKYLPQFPMLETYGEDEKKALTKSPKTKINRLI